jgi:hypothetical protein
MMTPDGNIIDVVAISLAVVFAVIRLLRRWRGGMTPVLDPASAVTDAFNAASLPSYFWMIGAVAFKPMLQTLIEASRLSVGLAGILATLFVARELLK